MTGIVVDTRGTFCPVPIIRTSAALDALESGGVVEVLSDDPAIEHDMPAWCKSRGHEIESEEHDGALFRYRVRKK